MSASTSNRVKAKSTPGWAALQNKKFGSKENAEAYPSLARNLFNKNLEKPFSSVLVAPLLNSPSLVDTTNRNSQRQVQVPVSNSCHDEANRKLKFLHPWADESLIKDVLAGVNNNVDEALSLLEAMHISEREDKDDRNEMSGDVVVSSSDIDRGSVGEIKDVSAAIDDSFFKKEPMFELLLAASKSLPIEPEFEWEDDDVYLIHRKDAIKKTRQASRHSKSASVAYLRGDHASALQSSLKAQQEWTAAEKLNAKAANEILNMRNSENDQWTLDLHGLHAAEAVEALRERLQTIESLFSKNCFAAPEMGMFTRVKMEKFAGQLPPPARLRQTLLQVITGKGNHSRGAAALPSAIRNFLSEKGYHFDETRSGVITIRPKFRQK